MTKVVVPNHGPDHCPGGPDPIPCLGGGPYAQIVWDDGTSIADNTPVSLASLSDFSYGYVSDTGLLAVNLTSGSIILDTVEGPGASLLPGLWLAQLKVIYENNFTGDMWASVTWTMGTAKVFEGIANHAQYTKGQTPGNELVAGETSTATSLIIVTTGGTGNNKVSGSFMQVSGSAQDLLQVSLTVERIETYPTANGAILP